MPYRSRLGPPDDRFPMVKRSPSRVPWRTLGKVAAVLGVMVVLPAAIAFAQPVGPETVKEAGSSLIKDTALGAITIICLALTVWAIRELKKVQDARVLDKEKAADRLEAANEKDRAALGELTKAVDKLAAAQSETGRAIERNTQAVQENGRTLENVVTRALEAAARSARGTGASGGYPAVRPEGPPPRPDPRRDR